MTGTWRDLDPAGIAEYVKEYTALASKATILSRYVSTLRQMNYNTRSISTSLTSQFVEMKNDILTEIDEAILAVENMNSKIEGWLTSTNDQIKEIHARQKDLQNLIKAYIEEKKY